MWEWAKLVQITEALNNKIFYNKNIYGRTARYMREENGNLELLHIIWEWAEKVLTAED